MGLGWVDAGGGVGGAGGVVRCGLAHRVGWEEVSFGGGGVIMQFMYVEALAESGGGSARASWVMA